MRVEVDPMYYTTKYFTNFLIVLLLLAPTLSLGQAFLPMDTLTTYPAEINSIVSEDIDQVIQVDFTGDSIGDYIIRTKMDKDGKSTQIWLTSDFVLVNRFSKYVGDHDFLRLINLDGDPESEIYSASGYSDGIDYVLYDLNLKTGERELLCYFNPVIIDNGKDYWGYPWDTKGIMTKTEDGVTMVYVSIDHDIERDGIITHPTAQKLLPVLFLIGQSTQPQATVNEIRSRKWKTLEDLKKSIHQDTAKK